VTRPISAAAMGLVACRTCGLIASRSAATSGERCRRCATRLRDRLPCSSQNALAWLVAGLLLYVPANMLPVLHISGVGGEQDSTILSGIVSFWRAGSWDIAAIIFTASVVVPATKFLALGLLLWTVRQHSAWARAHRTRLYRVVAFIGYWSMLDVIVVGLTAALLQFNALGTAQPMSGIAFFCAVVVTTMLAAMSFDPRRIWDE